MKKGRIAGAFCTGFLAVMTAGCGAVSSENTDQGMQLIEQMDYEGALVSFDAAAANHEDMQLICRGQGLAYMGLTDYENAERLLQKRGYQ